MGVGKAIEPVRDVICASGGVVHLGKPRTSAIEGASGPGWDFTSDFERKRSAMFIEAIKLKPC